VFIKASLNWAVKLIIFVSVFDLNSE